MSVNVKKPPSPQTLGKHFPGMLEAHRALQAAAAHGGPLDERTRELILLGSFTAARQEGGFKSTPDAPSPPAPRLRSYARQSRSPWAT